MKSSEIISDLENEIQDLQMRNEDLETKLNIQVKENRLNYKSKLKEVEENSEKEINKYVNEVNNLKEKLKQRENDME